MIIKCESCSKKFIVKDSDIPKNGRNVQCGYCSITWHQMPISTISKTIKIPKKNKSAQEIDETLSIDAIKASDGKTYKFLGSQWAQLLSSGKTGLFAKKKIGKELDKITGRNVEKISQAKTKKELDPSSQNVEYQKKLPAQAEGLGFFGYIFLLIIIGFSFVGILKTFETDLINSFPEMNYIYEILDEQLIYLSETVKNMIVIFNDLINSY
tara:strand:+ start:1021 stop:1653 length:633 start_codon:yes stop_codon:yes gene_type:complete